MSEPDFIDQVIADRSARNPEFPLLVDAARRRRELLRVLAEQRERHGLTQTAVAAAMQTSQSFVGRLETTAGDARLSTVDRYAATLGYVVEYHLIPADQADGAPAVVAD